MRPLIQILFRIAVAACAAAAVAMPAPTDEALEKVRPDVEELTKSDYAALEQKRMTHAELAASLLDYAKNAEDAAAVYLLRRAAFRQYVNGGDIPAAADLYDRLVRTCGAEYAQAIARFSSRNLTRQATAKVERAKEFLDRLTAIEKQVRAAEAARARAEKTPEDAGAVEKYAVALAVLGDWPEALRQFTRLTGRERELALFERRYPRTGVTRLTTADVAERWWNYPETAALGDEETAVFRRRAALWYRLAVTNGVLRGVRRQIAEKRAQEAEGTK